MALANDNGVIYPAAMRKCAKMRCDLEAVTTVAVRYADRTVLIRQLASGRDPNLLDLCASHAEALTPPLKWRMVDERGSVLEGSVERAQG